MAQTGSSVFLDSSSAEPMLDEAKLAWWQAHDAGWGDPARLHRPGRLAAQALDQARSVVAMAVGARPDEVVFTASGVLAAQAAVAGLALGRRRTGRTIVTSAVDHSSVRDSAAAYGEACDVAVDSCGRIHLDEWQRLTEVQGVATACLQVANHEVGTLQPVPEAAELCHRAGVPFVLDATAALGRIDLTDIGPWSVLIGSAGAFGGPPSVGIMVIRRGTRWRAPYPVDDYQDGRWPGPVDVPAIWSAAMALQTWMTDQETGRRQFQLVGQLRERIAATVPDVDVVGDPERRVPHLLTFSALFVDGETLTLELDRSGFAVASGSACSARNEHPSHVLAAMGALTHGNVRLGLTRQTTADDVNAFLTVLPPVVAGIRAAVNAPRDRQ